MEVDGSQDDQDRIAEQIDYYRARAPHYDEWWLRTGTYDTLSPERKAEWEAEVAHPEVAVDDLRPGGRVLELACGTGLWTVRLVCHAERIMAVDSSPEVIEINRTRTTGSHVEYVQADIFSWEPPDRFDVVFFSLWLFPRPPFSRQRFSDSGETIPRPRRASDLHRQPLGGRHSSRRRKADELRAIPIRCRRRPQTPSCQDLLQA